MNIETRAKRVADVLGEAIVQGTFNKLVQIEVGKCLRQMERLKGELAPYESRFAMVAGGHGLSTRRGSWATMAISWNG